MAKFDSKIFNAEAFGAYVQRIPNVTKNELAKSGTVGSNEQARAALSSQTGSLYARIPYVGRISGSTSQNNDGATDIKSNNTTTFEQGFITASRMDSWKNTLIRADAWDSRFMNIVNSYNSKHSYKLPHITPHICRHTFCSRMANKGMNPKALQYIMGHSDVNITLNAYAHTSIHEAKEEVDRILNCM